MRRLLCIFIGCFCLAFPLLAQSNKLIKELESKRGALQKQITESETLLKTTKKTVSSQLNGLAALTGQIEERKRYILTINNDVESIDRELSSLERQLGKLQRDLKDKKKKQPKEEDQIPNEEKDGLTEKDTENETEGDEADEVTDTDGESEEDEDDGLRVVTVTCTSDAKEYLADTFGISRTNLRSKAKIIEAAAKNGIKFEGLDE